MKKVFSVLMAVVFVFSTAVTGFALDMRPSTLDFSPSVSGRSQRVSKTVKTQTGSMTVVGYSFPDEAREVFRIVNAERRRDGKKALNGIPSWSNPRYSAPLSSMCEKAIQGPTVPTGGRSAGMQTPKTWRVATQRRQT